MKLHTGLHCGGGPTDSYDPGLPSYPAYPGYPAPVQATYYYCDTCRGTIDVNGNVRAATCNICWARP